MEEISPQTHYVCPECRRSVNYPVSRWLIYLFLVMAPAATTILYRDAAPKFLYIASIGVPTLLAFIWPVSGNA